MNFEDQALARDYVGSTASSRPSDLPSLRNQIEDILGRVRDYAMRAEGIGDQVFGSAPTVIGNGKGSSTGPASIVELVAELDGAVTRLGNALNRL